MKKISALLLASVLTILLTACIKEYSDNRVVDERCNMPPDPGLCQAAIPKYYYDPVEKKCKQFTWGGCGSFPFNTLEECESCDCNK